MPQNAKRLSESVQQAVFVGPALLFFTLIVIVPFLMSWYYGFTNWDGVKSQVVWNGLDNFRKILLDDDGFRKSFWFTVQYTIVTVLLTNVVGFLFALLLTQPLKTRNVLRTMFFLPNVIAGLLLGFIWSFIFVRGFAAVGEVTGIGWFQLPWLGTAETAFWAMVIVSIWQVSGYLMVIYISSLFNMPRILSKQRISMGNRLQVLRSIIIPLIMPAVTVCLFLTISWTFKILT